VSEVSEEHGDGRLGFVVVERERGLYFIINCPNDPRRKTVYSTSPFAFSML
jgi:hypothetical protein